MVMVPQQLLELVVGFCVLAQLGRAQQDCAWDLSAEPNRGLAPDALARGARFLGRIHDVSEPERCRSACCLQAGCELALVGQPADGGLQCLLVSCGAGGCALQPSSQFQVFRRTNQSQSQSQAGQEAPQGGETLRVVPLLEEPRSNASSSSDLCRLPQQTGSCRAAFPRFFYNVTSQSCSSFIFGGCEANGNNFETQADCEATCSGVTGSVLVQDPTSTAPPAAPKAPRMAPLQKTEISANEFAELCEAGYETGPCRAAFMRWFYNKDTAACQTFIYGGCQGNKNNYRTEESCKSTCTGVTVLPSSKKSPEDDEGRSKDTELCSLRADSGMCRAAFPKFYYDSDSASCQSFVYGGCGGNANNFDSLEECMSACSGAGRFDGHGKSRNRWTAAFFLFVTLAVIAAMLLATLVIMTLRRHRRIRRYSSISDKRQLIPDEMPSQDSISIPGSPKPEPKA